ncbi:MAG TPA: trigger factor [Ktedonobacteraceae bacterium]|nr:trigger factor [Ktedonobacteraceae bacterium]
MKYSVEKKPGSEAVLEVDFTWEDLEKASDKAYRKMAQEVDVPGFRRGKAPRSLLERRVGKEHIYQEGLDALISETYRQVLKENELTPIAQPELDAPAFEIGQPYHLSLKIPVFTPAVLGDYHALHLGREEVSVTAEEVEQELESLRNRAVEWKEVERAAEYGDRVTVDLKLEVEDRTISDLKDNPFELTEERFGIFTGMDEHIVGMQVGESKEFAVILPEDYTNKDVAGKEARYAVTLHKIEIKELPELDDAFAATVSDGQYETLEDLRKALSDNIYQTRERQNNEALQEEIVHTIIDQSQIALHPVLIREEAEDMLHQLTHRLEEQRMSLDQFLLTRKQTREQYLESILPQAEEHLKHEFVLEAVAEQEQITVAEEELQMLRQIYESGGQRLQDAQVRLLATSYRRQKALSYLVELLTRSEEEQSLEQIAAEAVGQTLTENAQAAASVGAQIAGNEEAASEGAGETDTLTEPTTSVSSGEAETASQ